MNKWQCRRKSKYERKKENKTAVKVFGDHIFFSQDFFWRISVNFVFTNHIAAAAQRCSFSNEGAEHCPFELNVPSLFHNVVKALQEVGVKDLVDWGLCQV